jgi:hypothetical protein
VDVRTADLNGTTLGATFGPTVWIDCDAAGYGWNTGSHRLGGGASVDLLSAVTHELGHVLGYEHDHPSSVMAAALEPGVRSVGTWAPVWESPPAAWQAYSPNLDLTRSVFAERFSLAGDAPSLGAPGTRWTPEDTSQATRVRDRFFESLALDEAEAALLESRLNRAEVHDDEAGTLEELDELATFALAAEASSEIEETELDEEELLEVILAAR